MVKYHKKPTGVVRQEILKKVSERPMNKRELAKKLEVGNVRLYKILDLMKKNEDIILKKFSREILVMKKK